MSEVQVAGGADTGPAPSRAVAICTDLLQGLLLFCVVVWVIDLPRRLFGLAFYTEQLLAVCLGFALALSFIAGRKHPPRVIDWLGAALSIGICVYITIRYEPLTYELAMLPMEGIIGSAILIALVIEATRRTSGGVLIGIILVLAVYVFIGPHMPGDFATRYVTPQRMVVYLGLDTNSMIGPLLGVAVLIVVPFTLMGQV
ncbi:MAG: hypothetical protein ACREDY_27005, partial [Bradyrhizobium sp.]